MPLVALQVLGTGDSQGACDQLTRGQCIHPEIKWKLASYGALSLEAIKGIYPDITWDVV